MSKIGNKRLPFVENFDFASSQPVFIFLSLKKVTSPRKQSNSNATIRNVLFGGQESQVKQSEGEVYPIYPKNSGHYSKFYTFLIRH